MVATMIVILSVCEPFGTVRARQQCEATYTSCMMVALDLGLDDMALLKHNTADKQYKKTMEGCLESTLQRLGVIE